jgi:hypothetical protein
MNAFYLKTAELSMDRGGGGGILPFTIPMTFFLCFCHQPHPEEIRAS